MRVNLGFRLSFLTLLILTVLVFTGAYFIYTKLIEVNNPLNIETKAENIYSSKGNNAKSESTAESFFRDDRERFFKK